MEVIVKAFRIGGGLAALIGFFILLGTAGASDLGDISWDQIVDNLTTALVWLVVGGIVLWATND